VQDVKGQPVSWAQYCMIFKVRSICQVSDVKKLTAKINIEINI